jgi:FixJ family two-component response regulator
MSHSVLILDDDYDLRTTLSDIMHLMCDAECLVIPDFASLEQAGERALACEVAIIDVNLGAGKPNGVDAYRWLVAHGFSGRIVFLTGHAAASSLVKEAIESGTAEFVQKPASIRTLCRFLGERPT